MITDSLLPTIATTEVAPQTPNPCLADSRLESATSAIGGIGGLENGTTIYQNLQSILIAAVSILDALCQASEVAIL